MLVQDTKLCTKCGQEKFLTEFYKKTKSKDGLQQWCKDCQNQSTEQARQKRKLQKRNTQLKRFSQYHLNKGLDYRIKGRRTKNSNRQEVVYKCLECGEQVDSTLDLAWAYKFLCKKCATKGVTMPLFGNKVPLMMSKKSLKSNKQPTHHYCACNKEQMPEPIQETIQNSGKNEIIKVIVVPIQQPQQEGRFTKWLKGLFGKKNLQ